MSKPTMLCVAGHCCIRVQKINLPLLEKGYRIHLIANQIPQFYECYSSFSLAVDQRQFARTFEIYARNVDFIHAHTEPNWFATIAKEVTDKPLILDIHDSFAARDPSGKLVSAEERNNFSLADGLVFPSESFGKMVTDRFGLTQPSCVLPPYVPRQFYVYDYKELLGGIAYEGRVDLKSDNDKSRIGEGFRYAEYEDFAEQAKNAGIQFHLYTVRKDQAFKDTYKDLAVLNPPKDFLSLLTCLTRHDWGLVGNVSEHAEWDVAMPNKLFEYLAAGVPVVAMNAKECGELVERYGIGISVKSMDELKNRWDEHKRCREAVVKNRLALSMESNIGVLENLYDEVVR